MCGEAELGGAGAGGGAHCSHPSRFLQCRQRRGPISGWWRLTSPPSCRSAAAARRSGGRRRRRCARAPSTAWGGSAAPLAPSAVPRLPRLPPQPCLVAFAPDILPGLPPGHPEAAFAGGPWDGRRRANVFHLISNPFCPESGSPDEESPGPSSGRRQHNGGLLWPPDPGTLPRTQGRRAGLAPIHSRTNLVDAELLDADSDF